MGSDQLRWIKRTLKESKATWKVIASNMPISIVMSDLNADVPKGTYEAWANEENGAPSGRELELANLLGFIKEAGINNVVWLTADVHYAQATYYNPSKAKFSGFTPFWEFVAGPIHAETFGPGAIDTTFGPDVKYTSVPEGMKQNRPPSDGKQYYGIVKIEGATDAMTVTLHYILGVQLYKQTIDPQA